MAAELIATPSTPPQNGPDLSDDQSESDSLELQERYLAAAATIGKSLQSKAAAQLTRTGDAQQDFLTDHQHFMTEIGCPFKLRRIGGAELDLYGLYRAVLERGGLQAVIFNRAFKMVAKALHLPKTCTSAAFILRSEYEKLLYTYEQKHVWGREFQNMPQLVQADRKKNLPVRSMPSRPRQTSPPPPSPIAVHPLQKTLTRSRRHAAQAVSNAVAAAAVTDDPFAYPFIPRRGKPSGLDDSNLDMHEEQMVEDEIMNDNAAHAAFTPGQQAERERVVQALQSPLKDDVSWALGTLNALSYDVRNTFAVSEFPNLLEALHSVLYRHMEDVLRRRVYGVAAGSEEMDENAPVDVQLSAMDVRLAGEQTPEGAVGVTGVPVLESCLRSSSLQQYGTLFNLTDPIAVDREQCAVVAVNILRNMSFYDRNAMALANATSLINLSAAMIENMTVSPNLRDGLMDMWINVAPYLNATAGHAGHAVLRTCIRLLDPFKEGTDMARFTNCGEVLARLSASPERNEKAITAQFAIVLPRIVDMLGGRQKKYVNAGLAALCNLSAFDWPARDEIARVPRALDRLVAMLGDPELAPRAAITLLNLAESPSNRSVLMVYERRLAEFALMPTPAADTVCSILFELDYD